MRIYIAGPMTGHEDLNRPAFLEAQKTLEAMGHEVFNPINHSQEVRHLALAVDLNWICMRAEGVVMLWNWVRSSGASAELATAKALGLSVWYQRATERDEFMSYDRFNAEGGRLDLGPAA